MAIIEARKRMDVTGLDISEQPSSPYILLYGELPFAIDGYEIAPSGTLTARLGDQAIVSFNARKANWLVIKRSAAKLATKEEIAEASAGIQKLQEEMFARYHPDEYKAYQQQRTRALGLEGPDRAGGNYL